MLATQSYQNSHDAFSYRLMSNISSFVSVPQFFVFFILSQCLLRTVLLQSHCNKSLAKQQLRDIVFCFLFFTFFLSDVRSLQQICFGDYVSQLLYLYHLCMISAIRHLRSCYIVDKVEGCCLRQTVLVKFIILWHGHKLFLLHLYNHFYMRW